MSAPKQLQFLKTIKSGKGLIKLITSLRTHRRLNKDEENVRKSLPKKQREVVLSKTDSHCHVCGIELDIGNFHADHVLCHIGGGRHDINNYLPSCPTCNNLRWHYSSEEIQIILKLGRWLKTRVLQEDEVALMLANDFVKHDMDLRKRRKANFRKAKVSIQKIL